MSYDDVGAPDMVVSPTSTPKPTAPKSPKAAVSHEMPKPPIGAASPAVWLEDRECDSRKLVAG